MTLRLGYTIIYLFLFCRVTQSQNLSKHDSLKLLTTWDKTYKYILSNDTAKLRSVSLDTLECTLCGFRNDTIVDYIKPISDFFKIGLIHLNSNKRLFNAISLSKPQIISGYYGTESNKQITYGIVYTLYPSNELGEKHEGVQVFFDYVIRENKFKLHGITTVP